MAQENLANNNRDMETTIMAQENLANVIRRIDWKATFTASVDRLLDSSPIFSSAARQAFCQFQISHLNGESQTASASPRTQSQGAQASSSLPAAQPTQTSTTSTSSSPRTTPSRTQSAIVQPLTSKVETQKTPSKIPTIPPLALLPALNVVLKKVSEDWDPMAYKLSLREFKYYDVLLLMDIDPTIQQQPITFSKFEALTREAFKNMALEKTKRLGVYLFGGIVVTKCVTSIFGSIPFIGKPTAKVMRIIMPTIIVGPLVGFFGATLF